MKKQLLTLAALICVGSALANINITVAVVGETTETQTVVLEEDGSFALQAGPHALDVKVTSNEDGVSYSFTCNDEEKTVTAAWSEEIAIPCDATDASVTFVATQE